MGDDLFPSANSNPWAPARRIAQQLDAKDSSTLGEDEIILIIATGPKTMRGEGNEAAHKASQTQTNDAVLSSQLTTRQAASMRKISIFEYGQDPTLIPPP